MERSNKRLLVRCSAEISGGSATTRRTWFRSLLSTEFGARTSSLHQQMLSTELNLCHRPSRTHLAKSAPGSSMGSALKVLEQSGQEEL